MWLFPGLSYATIAAIVVVLVAMAFVPDLRPQAIASAATVAIVTTAWAILRRPRLKGKP
jgi:AAT family amino acid transporter/GABA permease